MIEILTSKNRLLFQLWNVSKIDLWCHYLRVEKSGPIYSREWTCQLLWCSKPRHWKLWGFQLLRTKGVEKVTLRKQSCQGNLQKFLALNFCTQVSLHRFRRIHWSPIFQTFWAWSIYSRCSGPIWAFLSKHYSIYLAAIRLDQTYSSITSPCHSQMDWNFRLSKMIH